MEPNKEQISTFFKELQDDICRQLEDMDGLSKFKEDVWSRTGGGGGRTRVLEEGAIIEKGGVNFSAVYGRLPEKIKGALAVRGDEFYATGVSIVLHPKHPLVPIIHMNVRYFEIEGETHWFGGGIDLTPHYIFEEDAAYFHHQLKRVCDKHSTDYYPKFKNWADDYFFIKHRNETRGIGGVFFDRLSNDTEFDKASRFAFVKDIGRCFAPTYIELVNRNKEKHYTDQQKEWQYLRRGRYVEFNLVYDKGTKFGLETEGRIESILMSLPTTAQWHYDYRVQEDSDEQFTLKNLIKGKNWTNL